MLSSTTSIDDFILVALICLYRERELVVDFVVFRFGFLVMSLDLLVLVGFRICDMFS